MALKACLGCARPTSRRRCGRCERPRPRGNAVEPIRQAVLERDRWKCQDCGVKLTAVPHLPNSAHVAHRVAHVDRGAFTMENLYAACADCNLKAGAKGREADRP